MQKSKAHINLKGITYIGGSVEHEDQKEPGHKRLVTYTDSFLYPITHNGSTHNIRITLRWLFLMLPNPTNSPQPDNFSLEVLGAAAK